MSSSSRPVTTFKTMQPRIPNASESIGKFAKPAMRSRMHVGLSRPLKQNRNNRQTNRGIFRPVRLYLLPSLVFIFGGLTGGLTTCVLAQRSTAQRYLNRYLCFGIDAIEIIRISISIAVLRRISIPIFSPMIMPRTLSEDFLHSPTNISIVLGMSGQNQLGLPDTEDS